MGSSRTKGFPTPQARHSIQYAPGSWVVQADRVNEFVRDWALGRDAHTARLGDLNPLDPRGYGVAGPLPKANQRWTRSQLDRLQSEDGFFARLLEDVAEDTWGEGWTAAVEGAKAWAAKAAAVDAELEIRARFEEADVDHVNHGLALLYFNLEEGGGAIDLAEAPRSVRSVIRVQAIPRSLIQDAEIEKDPRKRERFGQPKSWTIRFDSAPLKVHWQRVIELRERPRKGRGSLWDGDGLGRRVASLAVLAGNQLWAAVTTYFTRAAPLVIAKLREGAKTSQPEVDALSEDLQDLQQHTVQNLIVRNFDIVPLDQSSRIPNPKDFWRIGMEAVSFVTGQPLSKLTGAAEGELASAKENNRVWAKKISRRRSNWATSLLREYYGRLAEWGLLQTPKAAPVTITWPNLDEPTVKESLDAELVRSQAVRNWHDAGFRGVPAQLVDYDVQPIPAAPGETPPAPGDPEGDPDEDEPDDDGDPEGPEREGGVAVDAFLHRLDQGAPIRAASPALQLVENRFEILLKAALLRIAERVLSRLPAGEPADGLARRDTMDPADPHVVFLLTFTAPTKELEAALLEAMLAAAEAGGEAAWADLGRTGLQDLLDDTTIQTFQTVAKAESGATAARLTSEIRRAVAAGLVGGEGMVRIRERVTGVFDRFTRAEAERIAQTEAMAAYNRGSKLAMRAAGLEEFEVDTAADPCPICAPLAGKTFPMEDAEHTPPFHPRCVLPGQRIEGAFEGSLKAAYAGPALELVTESGKRLSVTPNHPVLTLRGFVAANKLHKGDNLISHAFSPSVAGVDADHEQRPTIVEAIHHALAANGILQRMPLAAEHLHGDAVHGKGEVDVVSLARPLRDRREPATTQGGSQQDLAETDSQSTFLVRGGIQSQFVVAGDATGRRTMGGGDLSAPLGDAHLRPLQPFGVGSAPEFDASQAEVSLKAGAADAVAVREFLQTHAGQVLADPIVEVREFQFRGHVYDFQTTNGAYWCSGILVHNCRCRPRPVQLGKVQA